MIAGASTIATFIRAPLIDRAGQGASDEAASLEETSASTEEIVSITRKNADNALQVAGLMQQSEEALDCDLFLMIGTSAVVYPAASLVHEAQRRGAYTVVAAALGH